MRPPLKPPREPEEELRLEEPEEKPLPEREEVERLEEPEDHPPDDLGVLDQPLKEPLRGR